MAIHTLARPIALGATLVSASLALAACGDLFGASAGARDASLSFAVRATPTASAVSANAADLIIVTGGGHTVDLTSADVVFGKVKFERLSGEGDDADTDEDTDTDTDSDSDGNETEFKAGATTVSLPLEGGTITPFDGQLPVGSYTKVKMDADFLRVRGTYDGQAFDVTVPINAELDLRFSPPLVIGDGSDPLNVSVNVDVASWFRDANGNAIDPRQLSTNAELRALFRNRVRASFRAFEDADRDADESDSDSDSR